MQNNPQQPFQVTAPPSLIAPQPVNNPQHPTFGQQLPAQSMDGKHISMQPGMVQHQQPLQCVQMQQYIVQQQQSLQQQQQHQQPMQDQILHSLQPKFPTEQNQIPQQLLDTNIQQPKQEKQQKAQEKKKEEKQVVCDLHPKAFSKSCRKCKKILESADYNKQGNQDDNYVLVENLKINMGKDDNIFKMAGSNASSGMNPRLKNSILSNEYFKNLYNLKTFHEVIDEIQKSATHAQPWALGSVGIPSSFFCCLMKFMTMRLTVKQVKNLIDYKLSPMVRMAGFLYIRYVCDQEYLWAWLKRYLLDEEACSPLTDQMYTMPIGEFVEKLLMDQEYYGTRLPRIPIKIDNKIKAKLLITQEKRDRKKKNYEQFAKFQKDVKVRAISRIDEEWHIGIVSQVSGQSLIIRFEDEKSQGLSNYVGGEELVNLGEVELIDEDEIKMNFQYSSMNQEKRSPSPAHQHHHHSHPAKSKSKSKSRSPSKTKHKSSRHHKYSRSGSRDRDRKKKKKHHSSKRRKDKKRRRSRSYSSDSHSSSESERYSRRKHRSRSRSKDRDRRKQAYPQKIESNKEREQRLIEELKKKQAERSVAYNRAEVARVPSSYKTALSGSLTSNVLYKKDRYSASPRRDTKFIELQKPEEIVKKETTKHSAPSEKFLEQQALLMQKYGSSSSNNNKSGKNRDYA